MFFTAGKAEKRPGIYQRYENITAQAIVSATNGICAAVFQSSWGPLNKVVNMSEEQDIDTSFGTNGTTQILHEMFCGGAVAVRAVRAGTGGTAGTATLKDTTATPAAAITMTLKYPGARALQYMLRDSVGSNTTREFLIIENGVTLESFTFPSSDTGEVDALIAAAADSVYVNMVKATSYAGTGKLAAVPQTAFTGGANPTIDNAAYSNALLLLEAYQFNAIAIDTSDTDVQAVLAGYIDRIFAEGKMAIAVIGEPTSVDYATRLSHAAAFNDYKVVYVGEGWTDSATGVKYEGYLAAARIAGMVASIASNSSLTHKTIDNAADVLEMLTEKQLDDAIGSGMMVFTVSASGKVWIDSAITTLVKPAGEDDAGWKKIRRVKTRFEIMQRSSDSTETLIGNINNDDDGRAMVIQTVQGVLNEMVSEGKLLSGATVSLDNSNSPAGDSAWFVIQADDIDSFEKGYFTFQFRFSAPATSSSSAS